jgi:hypothetical protein
LKALYKLFQNGYELIETMNQLLGSTELNEAFHQVKANYANKRINYLSSTALRFAMAVIAFDNEPNWQWNLRKSLDLDELDPNIEIELLSNNQEKAQEREKRQDPEYQKRANQEKKKRREKTKFNIAGQDSYKPLSKKGKVKEKVRE